MGKNKFLNHIAGAERDHAERAGRSSALPSALDRLIPHGPRLIAIGCFAIAALLFILDYSHVRQNQIWQADRARLRQTEYRHSLDELLRAGMNSLRLAAVAVDGLQQDRLSVSLNERLQSEPISTFPLNQAHILFQDSVTGQLRGCVVRWDSTGRTEVEEHQLSQWDGELCSQTTFEAFRRDSVKANDVSLDTHTLAQGALADTGLSLAVPIRRNGKLAGMISSFIPAATISGYLELGNYHEMIALVSGDGEVVGCEDLPANSSRWMSEAARNKTLSSHRTGIDDPPVVAGYATYWQPLSTSSRQRLWLIYQVDQGFPGLGSTDVYAIASRATAALVLLLGLGLAYLVHQLKTRNRQLKNSINDVVVREHALEGTISVLSATVESSGEGILAMSTNGAMMNFNQRLMALWRLDDLTHPFGPDNRSAEAMKSQVENVEDFLSGEISPDGAPQDCLDVRTLYLRDGRVLEQSGRHHLLNGEKLGVIWSFRDVTTRERADQAIKQHLHFLQVLIDSLPDPVYYKDIRGQYLGCNREFERVIGRSREEIIGKSMIEVGGVPFGQQYYRYDVAMVQSHVSQSFEGPLVYANGTTHQVVFNKAVFFNADGTLGGIVGTIVDITQHKKLELALRESETKYRAIFESANIGFVITTDSIRDCNQEYCDMLGYTREEIIGKTPSDLSPEYQANGQLSREVESEILQSAFDEKRSVRVWQHRRKSGEIIDCEVILASTLLEGRHVVIGCVRDISERRRAEAAIRSSQQVLEKSEQYFRGLIENSTDLITVLTPEGKVLYASPSIKRLLGFEPGEIIGHSAVTFIHPDSQEEVIERMQKAFSPGRIPESLNLIFLHKDGSYRAFESVGHASRNVEGELVLVVNSRDMTERTLAEQRIQFSEETFRRLFEDASDGIAVLDQTGQYIDVNAAWCKAFGFTREEALTMRARDLRCDDDQVRYARMMENVLTGRAVLGEWHLRHKSGSLVEMEVGAKLLSDGRIQAIYHDLTERRASERALRESELRMRTLVEATSDIFFTIDTDKTILSLSPAFQKVFGWTVSEWLGRSIIDLVHPGDLEVIESGFPAGQERRSEAIEIRMLASSGGYKTLEIKFAVVERIGERRVIVGVARNITERIAAQEEIRKLSRAVEASPVGVVVTDDKGIIEYVNPRFTEMTGYSHAEVAGRTPRLLKSGVMPDKVYRDLWNTVTSGRPWHGELCNRRKDGELYWEDASISAITDSQGHATHFIAIKQDISDRIKKDQELRKLSAAVIQSANSVVVADPNGIIQFVNPKFAEIHGVKRDDAIGKSITGMLSPVRGQDPNLEMWEAALRGDVWRGVVQLESPDGHKFWIRRVASPVYDSSNAIISVLIVGEDITLEMEAQQKAMEQDKLAAVGVLAAGVSHEFKNYLGGIIGNASFALEELENETSESLSLACETLTQIIGMSERANQVAMSLLTYSKARPEEFSPTNLKPLVLNTINLVEKELRNRSIELVTHFEEAPEVNVSASKIQQLLLNLLLNAEHAIQESGVITVALAADQRSLFLKVGDTGCGIPPENLGRIFDPFFSTKGVWGKDKVVGTGMGLAICRNVAREHQGDLTVESTIGIGTTFTLRLPLAPESAEGSHLLTSNQARKFMVFSLDKTLMGRLFKDAAALGIDLLAVDDIRKLPTPLTGFVDLVVCDAAFSGKIELARLADACLVAGIPYVMVNCGAMEYQLSHMYEQALANFRELPELQRINVLVPSQVPSPE